MDKPFNDPKQGIKVIDVAIGHLAEDSNDTLAHIKRLKKVRKLLEIVDDGSWINLKEHGIDNLDYLYRQALQKASEKVGKHVKVFEYESRRESYNELLEDDDASD